MESMCVFALLLQQRLMYTDYLSLLHFAINVLLIYNFCIYLNSIEIKRNCVFVFIYLLLICTFEQNLIYVNSNSKFDSWAQIS